MSKKKHHKPTLKEDISPNVVPMIDIMFLLLLFFMLGADMSQRESAELRLPLANVPALAPDAVPRQLVANIRHDSGGTACALDANGGECRDARHWQRSLLGQDYSSTELARVFAGAAADAGSSEHAPELLVRADAHAPYGEVQRVFESAARAGIFKVELAAARRADEGGH